MNTSDLKSLPAPDGAKNIFFSIALFKRNIPFFLFPIEFPHNV